MNIEIDQKQYDLHKDEYLKARKDKSHPINKLINMVANAKDKDEFPTLENFTDLIDKGK